MTTPTSPPPSRWPRFIPRQFSVGAMLVLITVVACFLWWYVQLPEGSVTDLQVKSLTEGMTKAEVAKVLSSPLRKKRLKGLGEAWTYNVHDYEVKRLIIVFFDERIGTMMYALTKYEDGYPF